MSWLCEKCANTNCLRNTKPGEIIVECGAFKRPMTKADRIRAMCDDEMAKNFIVMLAELCEDGIPCEQVVLEWLQQPAEEDNNA